MTPSSVRAPSSWPSAVGPALGRSNTRSPGTSAPGRPRTSKVRPSVELAPSWSSARTVTTASCCSAAGSPGMTILSGGRTLES